MSTDICGVSILNVGDGDTKLTFDKDKPVERERAARIVTDMLRRGYAILVEVGQKDGKPLYQSATGFDPETCDYLIAGLSVEEEREIADETGASETMGTPKRPRGRPPGRRPAATTRAVAVGRSAGG